MTKKRTPRVAVLSGSAKVSAPVAAAAIGGDSSALDFAHFQSVQGDAAVVTAAGITNGMPADEIVRRVLAVAPRPV